MFKIQSYRKYRLGMLYFPGATYDSARRNLKRQILMHPTLLSALRLAQPNPVAKTYSALEVALIVQHLGYPPFREDKSESQNTDAL